MTRVITMLKEQPLNERNVNNYNVKRTTFNRAKRE